jgi:2-polyprenyl-3-methyl-5-hydroxy-6-metoxy-1,4-benzoquinol methylase
MLGSDGFNLWADGYDKSVGLSDEKDEYPFAGYRKILGAIYSDVLKRNAKTVLDIGFGTGVLSVKLCNSGCEIFGQDFSEEMIRLAQAKMPNAKLYRGNFADGLCKELTEQKYDAIIATYSLHHLEESAKAGFIKALRGLLNDGGRIYIGDVALETRAELEKCAEEAGDEWDTDENYFAADEMKSAFPSIRFTKYSCCAGLFTLDKQD